MAHSETDMGERRRAEPSTVEHQPTSASASHRYDTASDKDFGRASDRLLALLSTSGDSTWQNMNGWPVTNGESDVLIEEIFGATMQDTRLTDHGIRVLDEMLGSPIFDLQSRDRALDQDVADIAADWAYDIKPYHFAAIWRVFTDLRDGKIDHDTAMNLTEPTRTKIRDTIAKWGDIYDMIEETGSLDEVIAWATQQGIDDTPLIDGPEGGSDYRQAVLKEFTEDIYPGAADLPDDELTALLDHAAQQSRWITDRRRAVLGLLFYSGVKGHTASWLAKSTGMTYPGVVTMLRTLETIGLVEKIDAPRVTYALACKE